MKATDDMNRAALPLGLSFIRRCEVWASLLLFLPSIVGWLNLTWGMVPQEAGVVIAVMIWLPFLLVFLLYRLAWIAYSDRRARRRLLIIAGVGMLAIGPIGLFLVAAFLSGAPSENDPATIFKEILFLTGPTFGIVGMLIGWIRMWRHRDPREGRAHGER